MPIFAIAGFLAGPRPRSRGRRGRHFTSEGYLPTATALSQSAMSAAAAAAASAAAEPEPPNAVPPAAVRWISSQLSGGGRAAADRASYLPARGLDALQVKDLKTLCGTLESLLGDASCSAGSSSSDARTASASASADARARFRRPKSGSKKAAWIAAVRRCFYADAGCAVPAPPGDPIWALLLAGSNNAAATATDAPAAANNNGTTSGGFAHASLFAAAASPAALALDAAVETTSQVPYPPRAVTGSAGNASARQQGAAAFAGAAGSRKRPAPSSRSPPPPFSLPQPAAEPDRVDFFVPEAQWPPPNTTGGLRMLVQIKEEGHRSRAAGQQASSSSSALSLTAAAAATSAASSPPEDYYDDHPHNAREMSLLGQLRTMGFTDQREMLAGLRHVVEDGSSGGGNGTCGGAGSSMIFDTGTVLEGAMMWIISQREEAEEAKKMDLVRIVAENEQVEEERRRGEVERRLEEAPIEDIVGAGEGGSEGRAEPSPQAATPSKHKAGRSKHFHFSALLHSPLVRGVFLSISCPKIKKELVRLLRLEQKAHQWYGSVLPWAYFTYVATGRIEKWANDKSSSSGSDANVSKGEKSEKAQEDLMSLIRNEANILERSLFTLSEQHDNGLQNVPKIFIAARDNCAKKGLPNGPEGHATGDKSAGSNDDDCDVVLVTGTGGGPSKKSFNDDDDLDRKPAARPVASPNVSSRSPRRNCASTDRKNPAKASSEVIEIM